MIAIIMSVAVIVITLSMIMGTKVINNHYYNLSCIFYFEHCLQKTRSGLKGETTHFSLRQIFHHSTVPKTTENGCFV